MDAMVADEPDEGPTVTDDEANDGEAEDTQEEALNAAPGDIDNSAVSRELKRLSNPEVVPGRTRQQSRNAGVSNVTFAGEDIATEVFGDLRDDLKSRRRAGVSCPSDHESPLTDLEGTAMTQMGMKKGIKMFGSRGVDAVQKEL